MITDVPARLMGLGADYGLREGAWADLVITDCADAGTLVAGGADQMLVLAKGRPVSPPMVGSGSAVRDQLSQPA
jgi:cytosine deaminase